MATYVQTCESANFDSLAQTCAAPTWVQQPAGWLPLPDLSAQDASEIGFAIAGVWLVVWAWKQIGRVLDESSKPND